MIRRWLYIIVVFFSEPRNPLISGSINIKMLCLVLAMSMRSMWIVFGCLFSSEVLKPHSRCHNIVWIISDCRQSFFDQVFIFSIVSSVVWVTRVLFIFDKLFSDWCHHFLSYLSVGNFSKRLRPEVIHCLHSLWRFPLRSQWLRLKSLAFLGHRSNTSRRIKVSFVNVSHEICSINICWT